MNEVNGKAQIYPPPCQTQRERPIDPKIYKGDYVVDLTWINQYGVIGVKGHGSASGWFFFSFFARATANIKRGVLVQGTMLLWVCLPYPILGGKVRLGVFLERFVNKIHKTKIEIDLNWEFLVY